MTKGNRTNNDLQSITQKTKDRAIWPPPPKKNNKKQTQKTKNEGELRERSLFTRKGGLDKFSVMWQYKKKTPQKFWQI